jgi:putative metallohydrolase (TIGR04338 family)
MSPAQAPEAGADDGRAAVYAAEVAAFDGTSYESVVPFEHLVRMASDVTQAGWWPHGLVEVRRARADAGSSSARQRGSGRPVVRLAEPQMTPATVVHELAHVLAGIAAGHGAAFRRAHVDLAGAVFGPTEAMWLRQAYADVGLSLADRSWPEPPHRAPAGPIAL